MKRSKRSAVTLGLFVALVLGGVLILREIYRGPEAAERVRVTLGDRSYAIPTELQPSLPGAPPGLVQETFIEGRPGNIYVQAPDDPAVPVRSFTLGGGQVSAFAAKSVQVANLNGVNQLIFLGAPEPIQAHEKRIEAGRAEAKPLDGRPFLRKRFQDESFILFSRGPILFGSSIEARCNPFGDTLMCDVRGRISDRSRLRIMLEISKHPIETWPALFGAVEDFVLMMSLKDGAPE